MQAAHNQTYFSIKNAAGKTIAGLRVKQVKAQHTAVADGVVRSECGTGRDAGRVFADVNKAAKTIRIFGIYNATVFDKTFAVGEQAEYNGYNMSYYGAITSIGPKTVTIKHYAHSDRVSRLKFSEFVWRNYDFDLAKAARRNSEWND